MLDLTKLTIQDLWDNRFEVYQIVYALALLDEGVAEDFTYTNIELLWEHAELMRQLIVNSKADLAPWQAAHILFKENFDLSKVDRYVSNYDYLFNPY